MTSLPEWSIIGTEKKRSPPVDGWPGLVISLKVTVVLAWSGYFFVLLMRAINRGTIMAKTIIIIDSVS